MPLQGLILSPRAKKDMYFLRKKQNKIEDNIL